MYLPSDVGYRCLRVLHVETARIGNTVEVGNRELGVIAVAVEHDRPDKQREQGLAELLEIASEIEDAMVIERDGYADIMQRWGITLEVLNGIDISMEYVWAFKYPARLGCMSLYHIVIVGIDTGYHIPSKGFAFEEVHQHGFLAACQVAFRREHHLEITLVILELAKNRAPEVDIIVTLNIGHYPMSCFLGRQRISRLKIARVKIFLQSTWHKLLFWQRTAGLTRLLYSP